MECFASFDEAMNRASGLPGAGPSRVQRFLSKAKKGNLSMKHPNVTEPRNSIAMEGSLAKAIDASLAPVMTIPIDSVRVVAQDRRPIDADLVDALVASIRRDGLRTPIDVAKGTLVLCAGAHRLAACKKLGMNTIPARLLTPEQAKGWAAAENLFRGLRELDKSNELVRYVEAHGLATSSGKGGRQPHDKGYKRVADAIGWSRSRVREAYLHHALGDEIQAEVRAQGMDDHRGFLTKIAKMDVEAQRELLKQRAAEKKEHVPNGAMSARLGLSVAARNQKLTLLGDLWVESALKPIYDKLPVNAQLEFLRALRA